jgi:hypothetical protein
MSTTAIYRKAHYHKCGIAKTSVERCLPTLYRQAEAARLPQNGIFVHWELAAKLVDDNPTCQDLATVGEARLAQQSSRKVSSCTLRLQTDLRVEWPSLRLHDEL